MNSRKVSENSPISGASFYKKITRGDQHPPIYVSRSGAEHVLASELIMSPVGQRLLAKLAKIPLPAPSKKAR